jgi:uncharacterized lipoprotein YmbA
MRKLRALGMTLLLLASGCSFFSRTKNTIYTLDRIAAAAPLAKHGTPVAIDTVELPPGLDRREIVVRKAGHQLEIRANELWSTSLQPLVMHTLAFDLASRLPQGMVILPGETRPPGATRSIDVVFEELAPGPDRNVILDAQWVVAGVTHHERVAIDISSFDSAQIATGISQALAALADRIAAGV